MGNESALLESCMPSLLRYPEVAEKILNVYTETTKYCRYLIYDHVGFCFFFPMIIYMPQSLGFFHSWICLD